MTTNTEEVPLGLPYYNAPFRAAVARFWQKYATFNGRASRSEYWWWYLVSSIVALVFNVLSFVTGGYGLQMDQSYATPGAGAIIVWVFWGLWAIATIVPGIALLSRRLHDTDHSAWWILIGLIPIVGGIVLLVFTLSAPVAAGVRFD